MNVQPSTAFRSQTISLAILAPAKPASRRSSSRRRAAAATPVAETASDAKPTRKRRPMTAEEKEGGFRADDSLLGRAQKESREVARRGCDEYVLVRGRCILLTADLPRSFPPRVDSRAASWPAPWADAPSAHAERHGRRTVRPQPVREAWSTGAEVAGAPWQTRRPPPRPAGRAPPPAEFQLRGDDGVGPRRCGRSPARARGRRSERDPLGAGPSARLAAGPRRGFTGTAGRDDEPPSRGSDAPSVRCRQPARSAFSASGCLTRPWAIRYVTVTAVTATSVVSRGPLKMV